MEILKSGKHPARMLAGGQGIERKWRWRRSAALKAGGAPKKGMLA